tara:strand:- start:318 stop:2591 length:2274 start_codon:yes stop_codon:yes gene_type:complete
MIPMFSIIERYTQVLRDTDDSSSGGGGSSSSSSSSSSSNKSFDDAFAEARAEQGAGGTFTYNGAEYSTNYAGETGGGSDSGDMDYLAASGAASANYGGGSTSGGTSSSGFGTTPVGDLSQGNNNTSSAMKMDFGDDDDYTPTSSQLSNQMAANNQDDKRSDTSNVDYSQTSTGANYAIAAGTDGAADDMSGGTQYVGVPSGPEGALSGGNPGDTVANPNFGSQEYAMNITSADDAQYSDGVQKILVEEYGWTLGADGKAINPQKTTNEYMAAPRQTTAEDDYLAASGAQSATYADASGTPSGTPSGSGTAFGETPVGDLSQGNQTQTGGSGTAFGETPVGDLSQGNETQTGGEGPAFGETPVGDLSQGNETQGEGDETSGFGQTYINDGSDYIPPPEGDGEGEGEGQPSGEDDDDSGPPITDDDDDDGPTNTGYVFDGDTLLFNGEPFTGEYEGVTYENGVAVTAGFSQEFDGVTYTNEEEYNQAIADAIAEGRYEYDENGNLVKVDGFDVGDTVTFNGVEYVIDENGQITVRSVDPVTGEVTTEIYTVAADGTITLTSTTIETKIAEGMTTEQKTALLKAIFGADFDVTPYLEMDTDALNALIAAMLDDIKDGGGADTSGSNISQEGLTGSLQEQINALKATIASLQGQDGNINQMSYEDLLAKIQEMFSSYNADGYDPASYLNAFGFAMVPNADGTLISTASDTGMYYRKAVRDRDTGEIRYINVPINAAGVGVGGSISPFRAERRTGFGAAISV